MGTKWALFFGVVMLACAGLFVIAPFVGWWMPEGVSTHSWHVDFLFYIILGITGFFFILTEAILVYFMARFGSGDPSAPKPQIPKRFAFIAKFIDSEHKLELAWTIVPFVIAVLRYALVVDQGGGGAPEEVVLSDRVLQIVGVIWAILFAIGVRG